MTARCTAPQFKFTCVDFQEHWQHKKPILNQRRTVPRFLAEGRQLGRSAGAPHRSDEGPGHLLMRQFFYALSWNATGFFRLAFRESYEEIGHLMES